MDGSKAIDRVKTVSCFPCLCNFMYICICAKTCICICVDICICIETCICVDICICIEICICLLGWIDGGRQFEKQIELKHAGQGAGQSEAWEYKIEAKLNNNNNNDSFFNGKFLLFCLLFFICISTMSYFVFLNFKWCLAG